MSASDGSGGGAPDLGSRRRNGKNSPFLVLAAGLLFFAAIVGAAFLIMRPATLRIAVGPPGSDDQNLIQALAQNFAREGGAVRLSLIQTDGPVDSIALLRAHKADLAVARDDEEMPDGTDSVAIVRKNVVVLWSALRKGARKGGKAKIKGIDQLAGNRIGVVGRTPANVALLRVILKESGVNPDKVTVVQFNTDQIATMLNDNTIDAFMMVGPLDSKITSDAIAATAKIRGEPTFLPVDVSEAIASRHPLYESEEIPGSAFTSSPARPGRQGRNRQRQSSDRGAEIAVRQHGGSFHPAIIRRPSHIGTGIPRRRQDRKAGYRQGRGAARASRRRGVYRRHRTHLHG